MQIPVNVLVCLLVFTIAGPDNVTAQSQSPPDWLNQHMSFMAEGTGVWIADNTPFKSENEPFDAYATEWKWGVGRQSINGRLYAIQDGKEVNSFWEYHVFWHPAERKALFYQIGSGGAVGIGEMRTIDSESGAERTTEMIFYAPDGSSWKDLHRLVESDGEHTTASFGFEDGRWTLQRRYIWKLQPVE
jgi:hypothetical protein